MTFTKRREVTKILAILQMVWHIFCAYFYFMELPGNFPIFNIPGTYYSGIFSRISFGIFPNILGTSQGNVPRILHEHIFVQWVTA